MCQSSLLFQSSPLFSNDSVMYYGMLSRYAMKWATTDRLQMCHAVERGSKVHGFLGIKSVAIKSR